MITIGTSVAESRAAVALAAEHPEVWATVGVAPHDEHPFSDESLEALKVRVPEPVLVTLTVAGDGSVPPCMALNETDAGFTERISWLGQICF